ncbi:MAG: S-adenosylmethionine:tRNA ribosyltransferase-isomerase [Rikenellaceae bacterium]|nr:S-adenosylmethionine:tRNA ribosyltransferase-isomerase [Rikenellaceae bacterium]
MKPGQIDISQYDYDLPDGRIARFPLPERDSSKLLVWRDGDISESVFSRIGDDLPESPLLIFNDTRVIRARIMMRKATGAVIEIFCLEPHRPADYERSLAATGTCEWKCIIGNSKKWKEGPLTVGFTHDGATFTMTARRGAGHAGGPTVVFSWDAAVTFGQLLEILGRIPIPPYLGRESDAVDETRYQTVYSRHDGSVAAPTAGLHFTDRLLERLTAEGASRAEVTLHVGAGTFLPVKETDATRHEMHTEHFTVTRAAVRSLLGFSGRRIAVGTTTVRTVESLGVLGYRILTTGDPCTGRPVGQWEPYDIPPEVTGQELLAALDGYMTSHGIDNLQASTRIMIAPGYRFRITDGLVTNFHQPKSTLLLLVSAFTGGRWQAIYRHALENGFRFLSYGDSSLLLR